ncbi:MAG: PSD1 and planctomycete cytochrome C domain-containing protein, partial [Planctomycetes bacterium]|nr:PSD1 and planctomycete cytochrome C domain-containing protein [Planctomycetota bacterium]
MTRLTIRTLSVALVALWPFGSARAADKIDFGRDILPILSANCFQCHGPDQNARQGKLRLDTQDGALRTKDPVIVPGKSTSSELVRRIGSKDPNEQMPPAKSNRKLTPQQADMIRRWIDEGAAWGRLWAFVAPTRTAVPQVKDPKAVIRNPIDNFILSRLEKEGLKASPEAAKELLLRRVTLDLTGLPPTPEETEAFLNHQSPNAYEKVVDRLLASPRYGERMAWDWLDAARYADTNGYQGDPERTMWPWRDWVVKALNDNMPYDQFTIEQLAGDLLPNATQSQKIATGFNRNNMHNGEGGRIAEETRVENVMDRVETMTTVWMGATVGCARCHDHKFDPFTQREYYQLYAYFNNSSENGGGRAGQGTPVIDFVSDEEKTMAATFGKKVQETGAELAALEKTLFPGLNDKKAKTPEAISKLPMPILEELKKAPAQRTSLKLREMIAYFQKSEPGYSKELKKLDTAIVERDGFNNKLPRVMIMDELPKPRDTFILVRGAYNKPGDKVSIGVPDCLPALPENAPKNRLALAQWLMDPKHPLTARVTVNRYWQTFFGTGLVKTVEDFGRQGEQPSHPELLDWLATEFVRQKWDVKQMHRLIVTSAAYRQSSKVTPELQERDPENRLLARGSRFRLPSWMI